MKVTKTERGFQWLEHPVYEGVHDAKNDRFACQSSAIGDYDDSFAKPGSSFLWIGENHHLNREEVAEFVKHLNQWLKTGKL
jgi:hypothetical protein